MADLLSSTFALPSAPAEVNPNLGKVITTLNQALDAADASLKADVAAKAEAKKHRSPIDELEDKIMSNTAVVAAASGTPEQAKDMLAKARAKAMQAAADGADTGALDAMVWQMQQLAHVAEENRLLKKHGFDDGGAGAVPFLAAQSPAPL